MNRDKLWVNDAPFLGASDLGSNSALFDYKNRFQSIYTREGGADNASVSLMKDLRDIKGTSIVNSPQIKKESLISIKGEAQEFKTSKKPQDHSFDNSNLK